MRSRSEAIQVYRTALLILFIVTLLLVPLAQQIRDMRPGAESAQTSIAQLVRLLTLPTLDRIDHYEGQLEERSILRQWILPPTQYLRDPEQDQTSNHFWN